MKSARPLIAASTLLALGIAQAQFVTGGGGSASPRSGEPAPAPPASSVPAPAPAPAPAASGEPAAPTPSPSIVPAGPATSPTPGSQPVISVTPAQEQPAAQTPAQAAAPKAVAQSAPVESPAPVVEGPGIVRGNDRVIAPATASAPIPGTAAGLRFEDAPLGDVVHVVMRQMARVNYVIHPPISGAVTLSAAGNLSADDAIFLLENALLANGFVMAQDARGTYHIGRPDVVKNIVPAVRQLARSTPLAPGHGAIIIALRHIGAQEMATILRPVAGDNIVRVDPVRNLLVLQGNRSQAEGWLEMVNTFDVDMLQGMSMAVLPLKHITTREIDQAIRLLGTGGAGAARSPAAAAAPAPSGTAPAAGSSSPAGQAAASAPVDAAAAAVLGGARVIPMDRLNSLIIVAPRAGQIDEVKRWLDKIDQPGNSPTEPQLFVYPVQNGNAAHLASVLSGLFGGSGGAATPQANSGVAPALGQTQGQTQGNFVNALIGAGTGGAAGGGGATLSPNAGRSNVQGAGITTATFQSGLRVMADGINNAILIYGTAAEYAKIEATLKRLDVPPSQVLIEASIVEVTLNDDLQYGLQWAFSEQKDGGTGRGVLSRAAGAVLGSTPAGFSYTLTGASGNVRAVLNALADKSLVKVISSPTLMVMDNHTASIAVGTQQPVQAGQTITTGGNISSNIQYKDTGVNLTVTPSVNSGNMVAMTLNQSVTDVGSIDSATGQRAFLQRQIGSKVAVRSGETIVLGGLIRDNTAFGRSGIPFLSDLPLIGNAFGTSSKAGARTELLVMITPQVVRADNEIRAVANDLRDRMKAIRHDRESFFPNAPLDWTPGIPKEKRP